LPPTPGHHGGCVSQRLPDLYRRLLNDEVDVAIAEISHAVDDERLVVEALPQHPPSSMPSRTSAVHPG